VLALVVLCLWPSVSIAADPDLPDVLEIIDVSVYRHVVESDDFLAMVEFNIEYTDAPDAAANNYYLFRFLDSDGYEIGQTLPYSFGLNGYQYGVTGFYFSVEDAPTWEYAHSIKLAANPTAWDSPPSPTTWTMAAGDYNTSEDQDGNRADLYEWVIGALQDLETDWDVPNELITASSSGLIFTANGQLYIDGAIPGFGYMCPDLYAVVNLSIDWTAEDWTGERQTQTHASYEDTPIDDAKNFLSTALGGLDPMILTTFLILIGCVVIISFAALKWGNTEVAYCLIPVIFLYGSRLDLFPWALWGLFCFATAAYIGWMMLGRDAN